MLAVGSVAALTAPIVGYADAVHLTFDTGAINTDFEIPDNQRSTATIDAIHGGASPTADITLNASPVAAGDVTFLVSASGPNGPVQISSHVVAAGATSQVTVPLPVGVFTLAVSAHGTVLASQGITTQPPTAAADGYATPQNQQLIVYAASGVLLNDTAPAGHLLDAVLISSTTHGSLALQSDGSFIYTPSAGFTGVDSFTYAARDQVDRPPPRIGADDGFDHGDVRGAAAANGQRFAVHAPRSRPHSRYPYRPRWERADCSGPTMTFTGSGCRGVPPAGATGVVLNVTATEPAAPGFVQVFPAGTSAPGASSNVNVDHAGQTISDLVIVGLDASGPVLDLYPIAHPSGRGRVRRLAPPRP